MKTNKENNLLVFNTDYTLTRKAPAKSTKKPVKPLTARQRQLLTTQVLEKCQGIYARIFSSTKLYNNFEDSNDLKQEAWEHFHYLLNICDRTKMANSHKDTELVPQFVRFFEKHCQFYQKKTIHFDRRDSFVIGSIGSVNEIEYNQVALEDRLLKDIDLRLFLQKFYALPPEVQELVISKYENELTESSLQLKLGKKDQRQLDILLEMEQFIDSINQELGYSFEEEKEASNWASDIIDNLYESEIFQKRVLSNIKKVA